MARSPADPHDRRPLGRAAAATWGILLAVLAACGGQASGGAPRPSAPADVTWDVREVIDGDTLRVGRPGVEETVRLVGINAPERDECWASEATAALIAILAEGPVRLERDVTDRDRYGRLLRYARTSTGLDVGGLLIDDGAAIARAYPPDTSHDAEYRERQRVAREAGLGVWARDACGPSVTGSAGPTSIRIEAHPDAAGDDTANLNDEWVRFTNTGDAQVDLEGWTVRDESSSHRYRFSRLVLAPGAWVTLRSGCGIDTASERFWCVRGSAVWNNGGDTVFLLDPLGNIAAQAGYPPPSILPGPTRPTATA